ncbi:hypothetical protein PISL3812_10033 [Talaromyces islandicus]|uniref:C2H2-type domain-containing protein n=1 Tax=Talaromyces islandicus TaxID=28573 RepID=A0A0U1MC82_TALIS|nr:hypothetical protein PISL3812_10033 [Talaromyces islandicus]
MSQPRKLKTKRDLKPSHGPKRAKSDMFKTKAMQEVLKFRLRRILDDLNRETLSPAVLSTIAVSVTGMEKAMEIQYGIPNQLYTLDGGGHKCGFRGCSQQKPIQRVYNFNTHLSRHHSIFRPFLESKQCIVCGQELQSTKALAHHEKASHHAGYRTRVEMFAPCFAQFEDERKCQSFMTEHNIVPQNQSSLSEPTSLKESSVVDCTSLASDSRRDFDSNMPLAYGAMPLDPTSENPDIPSEESSTQRFDNKNIHETALNATFSDPIDPLHISMCDWVLPADFEFIPSAH